MANKIKDRIFSPVDAGGLQNFGPFRLGGRVLLQGDGFLLLSDAFTRLRLTVKEEHEASAGDLLLCEVEFRAGEYHLLGLLHHAPQGESLGGGEFLRLGQEAAGTIVSRGRLLKERHRALQAVRDYFEEQEFVEVETPTFAPCPGLDPHVHSLAAIQRDKRRDFLITSPEFHMKRLLVGGMPRIFQLARCFRAEELGQHHEPEFTLLEWYRAYEEFEAILQDTEEIVRRVFSRLGSENRYPGGTLGQVFLRRTVREAFREFANVHDAVALANQNADEYFRILVDEVEPGLARLGSPVFLTHYPLSQGALARACPVDPTVAERFELYLGTMEISNGYGELTCAKEQHARFVTEVKRRKEAQEPEYPLDARFLDALHEGLPPCSGNALGIDRLVALALGAQKISDTLAFSDAER